MLCRALATTMAGRFRVPAIPFMAPFSQAGEASAEFIELEAEVVALFDQMRGRILRYALSFGLSVQDAEEILQEAFLALYQHRAAGKAADAVCAWLFRVTHNLALKRRHAIARADENPVTRDMERAMVQAADPGPNPEDQFAFHQRRHRLQSVVAALPETDRECLYLRAEGLRYREIAEVLGISIGSVANSLARSLGRLSAADERPR